MPTRSAHSSVSVSCHFFCTQNRYTTIYAELRPRSRREGITPGQLREKQNILIRQLERKFGIMDAVLGKLGRSGQAE